MYYRAFCIAFMAASCFGCGKVDVPSPAKAPVAFNAERAPTVEFILPDMMCEDGCALAVEEILERQPGAKEVQVDFEAKTATVAIDDGKFDAELALADLVDKGFDHSELVTDETAAGAVKLQAAEEAIDQLPAAED